MLNTQCGAVGGCGPGDPQLEWLRRILAAHPARCTVAYFHRPPFSSGRYGDAETTADLQPLWRTVVDGGVDVVLTGHEHSYERLAPLNRYGHRDARGTRLFIVGTGGGNLRKFRNPPLEVTEVRDGETWGVLKLTLEASGYAWEFLPVEGADFRDAGRGSCS